MASEQVAVARTEALAKLRYARVAPRKLRRVADAIRGKSVREALVLLEFAGVFAAHPIRRLLTSAVANAENVHELGGRDDLYITRITVDGGPGGGFTKRIDPRAQGRAAFKRKRFSHVTIAVGTTPPKRQPRQRSGASIELTSHDDRRRDVATTPAKSRPRKRAAAPAPAPAVTGDPA